MSDSIRAALERLLSDIQDLSDSSQGIVGLHRNGDLAPWNELLEGGRYSSWLGDAIAAARAALAEQQGEGLSEYEWKDIGDGRPVQVQRCHKCGVCPSNVDDCGHFGDSRCPYFGIDALAAPSAPEPVGEGPSDKELNILWNCSGIADEHGNHTGNIFEFARAVLARWGHQPTPPAEGEVAEVAAWLRAYCSEEFESRSFDPDATCLTRAAELLQQQEAEIKRLRAQQTPVPVSEGAPGPEDCYGKVNCWWFDPHADGAWYMDTYQSDYTHWLPAHALPLPQGEVE